MTMKTKFVVIEGCMLAYVKPQRPDLAFALAVNLTGIEKGFTQWDEVTLATVKSRPATRADFETFRIHTGGYASDPLCEFPAA